jgi:deazaflavin-dependent oxidoreductase (nitroreductase family)
MSENAKPPLSRRLQARFFKIVNVPMRQILGLPVATPLGANLMLAFIIGRRTGKTYRQPISYVRDGETLLTPGGGKWKLNLMAGQPVRLRIRGKDTSATPELVADVDEVGRLLQLMAAANPRSTAFIGIRREADGGFDRAGLERAVRYGFRIVRWHPAGQPG